MRWFLSIAAAVLISPTAAQQQPYVPKETLYYVACLRHGSGELDDLKSDASTIARAVVSYCRAAEHRYLLEHDRKNPLVGALLDPPSGADINVAITIVLQERARRR